MIIIKIINFDIYNFKLHTNNIFYALICIDSDAITNINCILSNFMLYLLYNVLEIPRLGIRKS